MYEITECLRGSRRAIIGDNDREILIGDRRLAGGAGGNGVGRGSLWSYKFTSKLLRFFAGHLRLYQILHITEIL